MKKRKVLIVHNYYKFSGGEDTVVRNEKKMLEDNGHEVFMYTRNNEEINNIGIIKKIILAFQTIYSFKTAKEIENIVKEKKIDIVHVHNTLPIISPSVYRAAKKSGAKVIQTIHNFRLVCPAATLSYNGEICEKCMTKGLKEAIRRKCYRQSFIQTIIVVCMIKINRKFKSYNKIDRYIALTEFSKMKIEKFVGKDKIAIKPNFTSCSNSEILSSKEREYFVFIGRIDKLKGIYTLVEAWKDIKEERLLIVGNGPEYLKIKKLIEFNKINNIELCGQLNAFDIKNVLAKAKALIVPSICYETFGIVSIEAFSMGTPVIASDIGALSDIINENNGIKIPVQSVNSLREAVKYFSDYNNLQKYIDYCYKEYLNKYNANINYQLLMDIYSD